MGDAREIDVYYDVVNDELYKDDGEGAGLILTDREIPFLYYKEKPMIHLQLVTDVALTPYADLDDTWNANVVIDNDFTAGTNLCIKTRIVGI